MPTPGKAAKVKDREDMISTLNSHGISVEKNTTTVNLKKQLEKLKSLPPERKEIFKKLGGAPPSSESKYELPPSSVASVRPHAPGSTDPDP